MRLGLPETDREVVQLFWRLGAPVSLQSLLAAGAGLLDTIMVASVGTDALGGVGLISRVLFVMNMVLVGLASGVGVLVAQSIGAGRTRATRGPIVMAIGIGVILTLPIALVSLFLPAYLGQLLSPDAGVADAAARFLFWSAAYAPLSAVSMVLSAVLRSHGNTRRPMWAGVLGLGCNTILNFLFIGGHLGFPAFGVAAAALATSFARLLEIVILLRALRVWHFGSMTGLYRSLRKKDFSRIAHASGTLMLKEIAWAGGILASAVIVSHMGANALAAYNLVLPVEGLLVSLIGGCGVAAGIVLGQAIGAKQFESAIRVAERMRHLVAKWGAFLGVACALLVQLVCWSGLMRPILDASIHDQALHALSMSLLAFGARAHNGMVSLGILRSGNDGRWLMWVDMVSMWLINVPMVIVVALVWHWSLPAVVAVMTLEEILKVALFRWRVRSGRWIVL